MVMVIKPWHHVAAPLAVMVIGDYLGVVIRLAQIGAVAYLFALTAGFVAGLYGGAMERAEDARWAAALKMRWASVPSVQWGVKAITWALSENG